MTFTPLNPSQVTPDSVQRINKRRLPHDSSDEEEEAAFHHHTHPTARRAIRFDHDHTAVVVTGKKQPEELPETQPWPFSQHSQLDETVESKESIFVQDVVTGTMQTLQPTSKRVNDEVEKDKELIILDVYTIGRDPGNSLQSIFPTVSRHHAEIYHNPLDGSFHLYAFNACYVLIGKRWMCVEPGTKLRVEPNDRFRLAPSGGRKVEGVEFGLGTFRNDHTRTASASFDHEYVKLLKDIQRNGECQNNKKGLNRTLRNQVTLSINLHDDEQDRSLLPVTTLRKLFPSAAVLEAIWYLRGENHVQFLQKHNQKFWDKQAQENGWVGLNYGLLTNYPHGSGQMHNQLEDKVLSPLCNEKMSRNMVCTMSKPGEPTVQEACTTSVQFAVSSNNSLDMTVTQRSSDTILGLPHDVLVWSIILHLVRREVRLRTGGKIQLKAGRLHFCISAGGAHVYEINSEILRVLLEREPIKGVMPYLVIDESLKDVGMLELAQDYDNDFENRNVVKLRVADYRNCHGFLKIEQAI